MKLKSAVFLNALKVAYEQLQVRSAAVAPRLTLEAIQGEFVLFAEYFDNINAYDGTGAIDELSFAFFRDVAGQDNAHLVDAAVRAFNKALADQGIVTEEHRFDFFKELVEITAVDDAYQMSFATGFSDDYSASEAHSLLTSKPFLNAASLAEISVRGVGKGLFETPAFTDTHSFHLDHVIRGRYVLGEYFAGDYVRDSESAIAIDTFDKVVAYVRAFSGANNTASTTDANQLSITKAESDTAHLADLRFSVVSKAQLNTASTTDEGLLLTQNFAGFYFSGDYVGSSTTF